MFIEDLFKLVINRKKKLPEGSYTSSLFKKGLDAIAQKVGEEAVEVIIEAKNKEKKRQVAEIADLWFHIMVLMVELRISFSDIETELRVRRGVNEEEY
ncbi:MAG: phosphoribosyl-ATP diphosphatase [Candidatus Daviesbacteria bacterium]